MNKKIITIAVSALAMTSMSACFITPKKGIDKDIELFYDGINVKVPSLYNYNLEYEVFYSNEYSCYAIEGSVATDKALDEEYAKKFGKSSGLVSANSEYYPVEEYGYIFVDSTKNPKVEIYFYVEEGEFNITLWRNDGKAGLLDVSEVDTSWYVDYVREYGFTLSDSFPAADIKTKLNLTADIPSPTAPKFVYGYMEGDEYNLDTYYVFAEGDVSEAYAESLQAAGYTVNGEEQYDFFSGETYMVYTAYDAAKSVYLEMVGDDVSTLITFNRLTDRYVTTATTNTDWTDDEKAVMTEYFGEVLPFVQLGSDYVVEVDEFWGLDFFTIQDTFIEDRSAELADMLVAAGFEYDEEYEAYFKTINNVQYEANCGFYYGNYLEVSYEIDID